MKKPVVYRLCTQDGDVYVGSTNNLKQRLVDHKSNLRRGVHRNSRLQNAYNKGCFISVTVDECASREEAYALEQKFIDCLPNEALLNIGLGVVGGDNLTRNPDRDKIIDKIAYAVNKRNASLTAEERRIVYGKPGERNGMYGRTHTPETRELIRQKVCTPENIAASRARRLGVKVSDETRRKMSEFAKTRTGERNPFYGRHHSEETRRLIAERNRGNIPLNARKVEIDGIEYVSLTEAARQLGVVPATILYRLGSKNPKFESYRLVEECPETSESTKRMNENSDE
ncbi:GIY-YIG nuclease family protein [Escherichia coli O157]|nr:GIY-YIG nuclease family protein [Escherichia coli O157]EKH6024492.1 GIY-YIG nuclease family protein [Escherichia coli O157]EKH6093928.1 GIY-YIG nuclease family protein [Escherichia coli O157]